MINDYYKKYLCPVDIVSYRDFDELRYVREIIEVKECFKNAFLVMRMNKSMEYVEGYAKNKSFPDGLLLEHAWNVYKGYHIDFTNEIISNGSYHDYSYIAIISDEEKAFDIIQGKIHGVALITNGIVPAAKNVS